MTNGSLPIAIDPEGCGCTECIIGEYMPLEMSSHIDRLALRLGYVRDNTGLSWRELIAWERVNRPEEWEVDDV